jgi:hypothetical protein
LLRDSKVNEALKPPIARLASILIYGNHRRIERHHMID